MEGKDINGNDKACRAKCDNLAGEGCVGFVQIMTNDNQCKFIKAGVTHAKNNNTDVRDCHLYDPTTLTLTSVTDECWTPISVFGDQIH